MHLPKIVTVTVPLDIESECTATLQAYSLTSRVLAHTSRVMSVVLQPHLHCVLAQYSYIERNVVLQFWLKIAEAQYLTVPPKISRVIAHQGKGNL